MKTPTKMTQKPFPDHSYRRFPDAWRMKRLVWDAGTSIEDRTEETEEPVEAVEQKEQGLIMLEKHLGYSSDEAKKEIEAQISAKSEFVDSLVKDFLINNISFRGLGSALTLRFVNDSNKDAVNKHLQGLAETQAKDLANDVFGEGSDKAKAHAENSINILSQKSELAGKMINNLNEELVGLEGRQQQLKSSLGALQKLRVLGSDTFNTLTGSRGSVLQGQINRYRDLLKHTEEVKSETDTRLEAKTENKNDTIRNWHENVINMLGPVVPDERQGDLQDALRELGTSVPPNREKIDALIDEFGGSLSSTEVSAIKSNVSYLENGNMRGYVPGTKLWEAFGDKIGAVNRTDVYQYYLSKAFEIGKSNKEDDFEGRVQRLKDSPPGQKVRVGEDEFYVVRNDGNGFLMRKKGEAESAVYLNSKNGVLTEKVSEKVVDEKGKRTKKLETRMRTLTINKESTSDDSIDFVIDTSSVTPEAEQETTVSEGGIAQAKKGRWERSKEAVKAALTALKETYRQ